MERFSGDGRSEGRAGNPTARDAPGVLRRRIYVLHPPSEQDGNRGPGHGAHGRPRHRIPRFRGADQDGGRVMNKSEVDHLLDQMEAIVIAMQFARENPQSFTGYAEMQHPGEGTNLYEALTGAEDTIDRV